MSRGQASRYELIRKLGAGSIGVVYEAYDRERDTRVALKQLRTLSPAGLVHLRREFRVLRGVSHPNIIELYELVTDEIPPYFTMEFVDGQDFVTYARARKPLDMLRTRAETDSAHVAGKVPRFSENVHEERLRGALAQVAQAVQAIHEAGVVHRDLKPFNILVTKEGRAVVMDFSIAVDARAYIDETSSSGVVMGTPDYAAPEQGAGDAASPAADWYALGVILYQALTGRLPFSGTREQVLEDKQAYDAGPVSELVSGVPDDLQALCAALLARHPHERPSGPDILARLGVSALHDELARCRRFERVPFVGRADELAWLQRAWQDAAGGAGVCVLLMGAEGAGKTRLVRELADRVHDAGDGAELWFESVCHPVDQRPYNAFDDIMERLSRFLAALPPERLHALIPADHDLLPRMFPVCSRIPGVDRIPRVHEGNLAGLRQRAADVLYALLCALAKEQPLGLFIDNAHFADRDSVDLLCDLFGAAPPERVFLVMAAGSSGDPEVIERLLALVRGPEARLDLPPLEPSACNQILAWLTDPRTSSGQSPPRDGHVPPLQLPLRLIELARSGAGGTGPAPEPFAHRLDGLSMPAQALLELCAVLGHPAPISLLARAADLSMAERRSVVDALRSQGLVHRVREGREPWIAVCHESIRALALARLSADRRHELANRLATALQRSGSAGNGELGAGWRAANDPERAFPYFDLVVQGTRDRFAFHRSAAACRAALECAPAPGPATPRLSSTRVEMLACAGRYRQAAEARETLRTSPLASADTDMDVWAADHYVRAGDIERGLERLLGHVARLVPPGAGAARTPFASWIRRVRVSWHRRRHRERGEDEVAVKYLEQMDDLSALSVSLLAIAPEASDAAHTEHLLRALRHGERRRAIHALSGELVRGLLVRMMDPAQALSQAGELARRADDIDEPYARMLTCVGMGLAHLSRGMLAPAEPLFVQAVDIATWQLRDAHWELLFSRFLSSITCIERGHLRAQRIAVARVLERARRLGDLAGATLFGAIPHMWCAMAADRLDQAQRLLHELEAMWPPDRGAPLISALLLARAMGHIYLRCPAEARAALARDPDTRAARGRRLAPWDLMRLTLLARLAILEADLPAVANIARTLERHGAGCALGHASLLRAYLAHERGDSSGVAEALSSAVDRLHEAGAELFAMAARARLGQIVRHERGASLIRLAHAWCEREGIANQARMFDYLCPWSFRDRDPCA